MTADWTGTIIPTWSSTHALVVTVATGLVEQFADRKIQAAELADALARGARWADYEALDLLRAAARCEDLHAAAELARAANRWTVCADELGTALVAVAILAGGVP